MDSDIGATATLVQQQHQTLDGNHHQGQKEQDQVNGTVESAEGHAVDRFRGEAGCSVKKIEVVAPDNDSVGDSSTQCSDVIDDDNEEEETDVEESGAGGWIMNPPVSTIVQQHQAFDTTNGYIALPNPESSNFSDVRVKDSSNVHLGTEVNYNGPVTINQFVYTNSTPNQDAIELDVIRPSDNISDLSTNKDNGASNGCIFPQYTNLNKVMQWLWTWKRAVLSCVLTLILPAIVVPITVHFTHPDVSPAPPEPTTSVPLEIPDSSTDAIVVPITVHFTHHPDVSPALPEPTTLVPLEIPDSSTEDNNGTDTSFRIVERDEWGAHQPSRPLIKIKLPVPYVIIGRSPSHFCTTQSECTTKVRFIQVSYLKSKFEDIGYNFLVGGDGLAYVGRNWDYVGEHTCDLNDRSIGISFIGNFSSVVPSKLQLRAARKIIELGVKAGKITPDYKLLDSYNLYCLTVYKVTGDALYNEIIKWPHWSSEIPDQIA
ncbi:uncharacterized protein [Temnothorax longispinosus]|uniref:uncharacterized protein n=1 Tax=Temnothorax longispinosus TaxID=300112 RepID=UPI003A98F1EE